MNDFGRIEGLVLGERDDAGGIGGSRRSRRRCSSRGSGRRGNRGRVRTKMRRRSAAKNQVDERSESGVQSHGCIII